MPITPERLAANGQEHDHQVALFQWIAIAGTARFPLMRRAHSVPNGGKLIGAGTARGRSEGARMKAEGLRPGVPDIFVPVPNQCAYPWPGREHDTIVKQYHGLWIELKRPGREGEPNGGRSEEQVDWCQYLVSAGYGVVTAYGWQAGAHALSSYFSGTLRMPDGGDCQMLVEQSAPPW